MRTSQLQPRLNLSIAEPEGPINVYKVLKSSVIASASNSSPSNDCKTGLGREKKALVLSCLHYYAR